MAEQFGRRSASSNYGLRAIYGIHLTLKTPADWSAVPTSASSFKSLSPGHALGTSFVVTVGAATASFSPEYAQASADDWTGNALKPISHDEAVEEPVETVAPVASPFQAYSSAVDAPASFRQSGGQIAIQGAGADVYSTNDTYSAVYQHGVVGNKATVTTEVVGQDDMTGYAKGGIMIRNDIAGSGSSPEGVILYESPSAGIQMEWDNDDGYFINSDTPGNGSIVRSPPVWLRLVRNGPFYRGYYSTDGNHWLTVGTAVIRGQAPTQDAGDFMVRHAEGSLGDVTFQNFSVS